MLFEVNGYIGEDLLTLLESIGGKSSGRYKNSGDTDIAREFREVGLQLAYIPQGLSTDSEALFGALLLLLQSFSEVLGGLSADSKALLNALLLLLQSFSLGRNIVRTRP